MYNKIEVTRHSIPNLGIPQVGQAQTRGEIFSILDSMDSLLGELEFNINELSTRIETVLAPPSPGKDKEASGSQITSPLALSLFSRNERLVYFNSLLRELAGRVQL